MDLVSEASRSPKPFSTNLTNDQSRKLFNPLANLNHCKLLSLPIELRLYIWELALGNWGQYSELQAIYRTVVPMKSGRKYINAFHPTHPDPIQQFHQLSTVCRFIHDEITIGAHGHLLYKLHTMKFTTPTLSAAFLTHLKPSFRHSIRSVSIRLTLSRRHGQIPSKCFHVLARCRELQRLAVHVNIDYSLCPSRKRIGAGLQVPQSVLDALRKASLPLKQLNRLQVLQLALTVAVIMPCESVSSGRPLAMWCETRKTHKGPGERRYQKFYDDWRQSLIG